MADAIFVYTAHARDTLRERNLSTEWVEATVLTPDADEPDPTHPERRRAFRASAERDGRILRVVYVRQGHLPDRHGLSRSWPEEADVKTRYDADADALYLRLAEGQIAESDEVRPGIVLDLDAEGRVVGIEILDASRHLADGADLAGLAA